MKTDALLSRLQRPFRRGEVENLRGLSIDEPLELQGVGLPNIDFTGSTFNAPVVIRGSTFRGLAWFDETVFNEAVDFSSSVFFNDCKFRKTKFRRAVSFSHSEFRGVACFDLAQFSDAAFLDRMICYANLSLEQTCFAGVASLQDTECLGGLWGNQVEFRSRMDARGLEVHGRTWLVGASFGDESAPSIASQSASSIQSLGYRWV
jgi:uncharacterized protein YjbI with pentapeptide repeats